MKSKLLLPLLTFLLLFSYIHGQQRIDGTFAFQTDPAKKYSIYVPSTYVASVPNKIMLGLHPLNTSRWNGISWCDTLINFAESNGLLLICPDGGPDGRIDDAIDTAFTSAVLDSMELWYNVDTDNIYAMGFSWGGRTTYTYGLSHSNQFAGLMPIGAAISGLNEATPALISNSECKPVYIIHGSSDSPNNRYFPVRQALIDSGAVLESLLMPGVGHTIDFPNRNQILTTAFQFLDSAHSAPVHAEAGADASICAGVSVQLGTPTTASGGTCPYTYAWSPALGLSATNEARPTATPMTTTTYFLTVIDDVGGMASDSVTITVNIPPIAQASQNDSICVGDSASLSASGGTTYTWSPAFGLSCVACPNPNASPFFSQNYIVTVGDANGCTDTASVQVEVLALPAANAGMDQSYCEGDSFMLNGMGGSAYTWTPATGLSDANSATPAGIADSSRLYTLSVQDANGCTAEDQVQITVNENPVAQYTFSNTNLDYQFTDISSGTPTTWLWDLGDGTTSSLMNPPHTYAAAGTYLICLTVTTPDGCTDSTCTQIDALTSREDPILTEGVSIYRSGSDLILQFNTLPSESLSVQLIDLQGKGIVHQSFAGLQLQKELRFALPAGTEGIYIISLQSASGQFSQRIWIEK